MRSFLLALTLALALPVLTTAGQADGPPTLAFPLPGQTGDMPAPAPEKLCSVRVLAVQKDASHVLDTVQKGCKPGEVLYLYTLGGVDLNLVTTDICDFSKRVWVGHEGNLLMCVYSGKRETHFVNG